MSDEQRSEGDRAVSEPWPYDSPQPPGFGVRIYPVEPISISLRERRQRTTTEDWQREIAVAERWLKRCAQRKGMTIGAISIGWLNRVVTASAWGVVGWPDCPPELLDGHVRVINRPTLLDETEAPRMQERAQRGSEEWRATRRAEAFERFRRWDPGLRTLAPQLWTAAFDAGWEERAAAGGSSGTTMWLLSFRQDYAQFHFNAGIYSSPQAAQAAARVRDLSVYRRHEGAWFQRHDGVWERAEWRITPFVVDGTVS